MIDIAARIVIDHPLLALAIAALLGYAMATLIDGLAFRRQARAMRNLRHKIRMLELRL
ncbi:MAG TPA: hypothetical protein VFG22_01990 [Polyangiales bacterium]|nr:hypothetical protein [Polyangiales bacterium]